MGTDKKDKFGLWSIVLLGINGYHRDGNLSPAKPGLCPDGTVKSPDSSF